MFIVEQADNSVLIFDGDMLSTPYRISHLYDKIYYKAENEANSKRYKGWMLFNVVNLKYDPYDMKEEELLAFMLRGSYVKS